MEHWKTDGNKLLLSYNAPEGVEVIVDPKGFLATKELIVNG
jgi:hypothetical protein